MDDVKTRKAEVLPLAFNEHGSMRALVREGDSIRPGTFHPLKSGQPIPPGSDYACVRPREDSPVLDADITELSGATDHEGPPRVNSAAYREGWDRIWGSKGPVGEA